MTNPEWVEAGTRALDREGVHDRGMANDSLAWVVVNAVEPLIRADERERAWLREPPEVLPGIPCRGATWCVVHDSPWGKGRHCSIAHAEAVAARLVEVIVEMQSDIDHAWAVANGEARR